VQSLDGSLVVGDSHHDTKEVGPFIDSGVTDAILCEMHEVLQIGAIERQFEWLGWYPVSKTDDAIVVSPLPELRVVSVTSGTGASTAFGLAEEVINEWNA